MHPRSRAGSLGFRDRGITTLPTIRNGQGGRPCTCVLRDSPGRGRLLLKLHLEIGCQTWTRTKTSGLTGRRATLTPPGNGAAGRIPTCIVPFRRRMPHVFGHGSNLKLVSAAGFAPAVTRSQAGHVAATPRAGRPGVLGEHRGLCFMGIAGPKHLEPVSRGKIRKLADPKGVAPWWPCASTFPQTTGCSAN